MEYRGDGTAYTPATALWSTANIPAIALWSTADTPAIALWSTADTPAIALWNTADTPAIALWSTADTPAIALGVPRTLPPSLCGVPRTLPPSLWEVPRTLPPSLWEYRGHSRHRFVEYRRHSRHRFPASSELEGGCRKTVLGVWVPRTPEIRCPPLSKIPTTPTPTINLCYILSLDSRRSLRFFSMHRALCIIQNREVRKKRKEKSIKRYSINFGTTKADSKRLGV